MIDKIGVNKILLDIFVTDEIAEDSFNWVLLEKQYSNLAVNLIQEEQSVVIACLHVQNLDKSISNGVQGGSISLGHVSLSGFSSKNGGALAQEILSLYIPQEKLLSRIDIVSC